MNRYPAWKFILIAIALLLGLTYSIPNLFGESPAVQISSARSSVKVDTSTMAQMEKLLAGAKIPVAGILFDGSSLKVKLSKYDDQVPARELIQKTLGENYVVALNQVPNTPAALASVGAQPMALGLDLRGGVHFLLELNMKQAVDKAFERISSDARRELKDKKIRYGAIKRVGQTIEVQFRDGDSVSEARKAIEKTQPNLLVSENRGENNNKVILAMKPEEGQRIMSDAVKQNVAALHNRINELGVAEPIIQQQGLDRIVVELPGVQDTAKAKEIIGRTASLEIRLVADDQGKLAEALAGNVPAGFELMDELDAKGNRKILVRKEVELTGENINDAQTGFDDKNEPAVHIRLDAVGGSIFRQVSRDNIGKRLAMILVEKGKGQVVTAPVIRSELGSQFQISGAMSTEEANMVSLLLRAGSLAAEMEFVEERTVGPSLGKENIEKGLYSTLYGFIAITLFMLIYYRMFGITAAFALAVNLLLLLAVLSRLGVTLSLPGIAAIALTLGMAIDSNVLINERIREEVRNGMSPQAAINAGYEHAWATILDSNITTLIAGLALLIFGSGAIRSFAWVHCIGILTSMFSAVFVSRGLVNLIYGYRRRVKSLAV